MNFGQPEEEVTMEKLLAAERELDMAEMDRQVAGEVNQDPNSYLWLMIVIWQDNTRYATEHIAVAVYCLLLWKSYQTTLQEDLKISLPPHCALSKIHIS